MRSDNEKGHQMRSRCPGAGMIDRVPRRDPKMRTTSDENNMSRTDEGGPRKADGHDPRPGGDGRPEPHDVGDEAKVSRRAE